LLILNVRLGALIIHKQEYSINNNNIICVLVLMITVQCNVDKQILNILGYLTLQNVTFCLSCNEDHINCDYYLVVNGFFSAGKCSQEYLLFFFCLLLLVLCI